MKSNQTKSSTIEGVATVPLKQIPDKKGTVMHILKADSELFTEFGEVFISAAHQNCVRAWKTHLASEQYFAAVSGKALFVLYDAREESETFGVVQEVILSPIHYDLLFVPRGVVYGYKGLSEGDTMLVCVTSIPHDPSEIKRYDLDDKTIPYRWE